MRKLFIFIFASILFFQIIDSSTSFCKEKPSTPAERQKAFEIRKAMQETSLFKNLSFRSVGPVVMSGRVVDIEPSPTDHYTFYVAYATGGLWRTNSNGLTFTPIFDNQNAITIGDIAIDPKDEKVIWVGTGEKNSSRSSYSGTGIYKTIDGGKTWNFIGLGDSHHTGRIVIHPENTDIVYVAALGHLYTENEERGIYKTVDGGKSWTKSLYISPRTGFIDLAMDPQNPEILYAAAWEKDRKAWNFIEGGKGSGIYKTTDGGATWKLLSEGLPQGDHVGRIGLTIFPQNTKILYALIDNQMARPEQDQGRDAIITPRKLLKMTVKDILTITDDDLQIFLRWQGFHPDYTAEIIKEMLSEGKLTPNNLIEFIRKNNPQAFNPEIIGAEVYRSDDAGATWNMMNEMVIDNFYSTYGYYFGEIRVAPDNADQIYILGIPLLESTDAGKTYHWRGGEGVHADHQAMWIDPNFPDHLIDGNDGGLNLSYDGGKTWWKLNSVPVGQFYSVQVDMAEPYNIYGGLQDNGVYMGSSKAKPTDVDAWEGILGGDGMQVQIDPEDFTIYTGSQFGYYARIDAKTKRRTGIKPLPKLDEPALRFNWQTPIQLSSHSSNIFYYGANRLFRSFDRGENLKPISPDLTTNLPEAGDVPFATLTTIAESKKQFGLIYIGTDDGRIWVTRDAGFTWNEIGKSLPQGLWCSRVEASAHWEGTVYVSLNGYRNDDFRTYLFRSKDYGKTWESIRSNLPDEAVNVVREDPYNPHVLYVGTDMGVFVSLDAARTWQVLQTGIPISPAHDLVVHPRDRELVVGTHGRSIYVMNVLPIQELTPKIMEKALYLFDLKDVRDQRHQEREPASWSYPSDTTFLEIYFWLKQEGNVTLTVKDNDSVVVQKLERQGTTGINTIKWDLSLFPDPVLKSRETETKKKLDKAEANLKQAQNENKADKEIQQLMAAQKKAIQEHEAIQKRVDEAKKYADLPDAEKRKKLTPVYVSEGDYAIELTCKDATEKTTLKVLPLREGDSGKAEREKLNKYWEQEKKRKQLLEAYK
ncbi:glycosyl hydrolase [candidate division KSB1 bacterium]|nr:glycosyl hydrolase [candidate division KSB1 bacterium]